MRLIFALSVALVVLCVASSIVSAQTPPFTQCAPVGSDLAGCRILILIDTNGSLRVLTDPTQPVAFDNIEDTLIGVLNLSSNTIASIPLRGSTAIFSLDGDGICGISPNTGLPYAPAPPGCPFGPTGYEGPGVTFTNISADKTFGIVNFNPPLAASGGRTYFSLELAIQTLCPGISPPSPLKQGDTRWTNIMLDGSTQTIGAFGCFITSAAMEINYHAARQNKSFRTDPAQLDTYLTAKNAFYPDGAVRPDMARLISQYAIDNGVTLYGPTLVDHRDDFTLDQYLCSGQPPMLFVGNPHWVLSTGQTTVGTNNTYSVIDPDTYPNDTTLQGWNYTYNAMALFTDIVGPLAALYVTAHSPVELVVTAPDGSQTGFDSTTGTHLNSIPLSAYLALSLANDQFKMLSPTPEIKSFSANDPKSGSYVVQVFGTNTGEYTLDFTGYDTDGKISQAPSLTGSIIPGVTKQLTISYSSAAGSSVTVTQAVTTIANIQTEIEIAAQQGFIDNRGIVNSLSSKLRNAQAAFSAGQPQVAQKILAAFVSEVSAQSGIHIQTDAANLLVADATSAQQ